MSTSNGVQQTNMSAAVKEVRKRLCSWYESFNKGDMDSIVALYADNCVVLPHGHPMMEGPEGARKVFSGFKAAGNPHIPHNEADYDEIADGVIISTGRNVIEWGTGEKRKLKDVVVWKKQKSGEWKIFRDCFNWDLP